MVSYRWYIQSYTSHMSSEMSRHMNDIWQFIPVICLVAWEQAAPGAPARSRIALEMQRHRVWIARVFIVPVHHSTRRCHWAAVTASMGQPAPPWTQVVTRATDVGGSGWVAPPPPAAGPSPTAAEDDAGGHKVAPPTSAAVVVSWLRRAALAADCRVHKQMTSVGIKMN